MEAYTELTRKPRLILEEPRKPRLILEEPRKPRLILETPASEIKQKGLIEQTTDTLGAYAGGMAMPVSKLNKSFLKGGKVASEFVSDSLKDARKQVGDGIWGDILGGLESGADWVESKFAGAENIAQRDIEVLEKLKNKNKTAGVIGEFIADPVNVFPAGVITKGGKSLRNTLKSVGVGGTLGATTSIARDYGDKSASAKDMAVNAGVSGLAWGGLNGLFASKKVADSMGIIFDKLSRNKNEAINQTINNIKQAPDSVNPNDVDVMKDIVDNPQAFGLNKNEAKMVDEALEISTKKEHIKGENFVASEPSKTYYPENATIDIDEALRNEYLKNDNPVVASIAWLYERHPEMFKSKADVYRTIQAVKENPDLITSGKSADSVMFAKKLNDEKMGDMVISRGDENKIIHANKKRLKNKSETSGRDPHTLYTPVKQAGELSDLRSGANAHSNISEASNDIIPQANERFQALNNKYDVESFLAQRENISAKDSQYPNKRVSKGGLNQEGDIYVKPTYEKNPNFEFSITKKDVKDLRNGKITDELINKLENDLTHPHYEESFLRKQETKEQVFTNEFGEQVDKNGHYLFAKGGDNLMAGLVSSVEKDENGNISFNPTKFALGLGGYSALKGLATNKRVREFAKDSVGTFFNTLENKAQSGDAFAQAILGQKYIVSAKASVKEKRADLLENFNVLVNKMKARGEKLNADQQAMYDLVKGSKNAVGIQKRDADNFVEQVLITQGYHDARNNVGKGLEHFIFRHYGTGAEGELSANAILNIGKTIQQGILVRDVPLELGDVTKSFRNVRVYKRTLNPKTDKGYYVVIGEDTARNKEVITYYSNLDSVATKDSRVNPQIRAENQQKSGYNGNSQSLHPATSVSKPLSNINTSISNIPLNNTKKGFTDSAMVNNIIGAGSGALIGGAVSEDDRIAGAIAGAGVGIGVANAKSMVNLLKKAIGNGENKAIESISKDNKVKEILKEKTADIANKLWSDLEKTEGFSFKGFLSQAYRGVFNPLSKEYNELRKLTKIKDQRIDVETDRLANALKVLDEKTRKDLHNALVDEGDIPKGFESLVESIRSTITNLNEEMVKGGILSQQSFDEWVGAYLTRAYNKYQSKSLQGLKSSVLTIDKIHARGKKVILTDEQYQKKMGELEFNTLLNTPLRKGGIRATQTKNGKWEIRRDYTKQEREAMGEITDGAYTIPLTIAKLRNMVNHAEFLEQVKHLKQNGKPSVYGKFEAKELFPELNLSQRIEAMKEMGFVKMPDNEKYAALQGQFVDKHIATDITNQIDNIYNTFNGKENHAFALWKNYLSMWKKSKTIYNLPAHVNNFASNMFLMHLHGFSEVQMAKEFANTTKVMWLGKNMKAYKQLETKSILNQLSPNEAKAFSELRAKMKYYIEARDAGILGKGQLRDLTYQNADVSFASGKLDKMAKGFEKAYQAEDDFGRVMMFSMLRKNGKSIDEASNLVLDILPDYTGYMPSWIRFSRDSGLAPFISWSYYVLPKMAKQLFTTTGAIQATKVMATLAGMQYALTGVNPLNMFSFYDDGAMPKDFKGREFAFRKSGDKITTFKTDRIIPYQGLTEPINYVAGIFSSPSVNLFTDIRDMAQGNIPINKYRNRPITYANKKTSDKAVDYIKHLATSYVPLPQQLYNTAGLIENLTKEAKRRKTNDVMLPRNTPQEVLRLLGINTKTYSLKNAKKEYRKRKDR